MYDRESNSEWLQLLGTAIEGKLAGVQLKRYSVAYDTWASWKKHHPNGRVLAIPQAYAARFGAYDDKPYFGYEVSNHVLFPVSHEDARLPRKAPVIGVEVKGAAKAYLEELVWKRGAIDDVIGGLNCVLLADRASSRIGLFTPIDHHFTLQDGKVRDERGHEWTWNGDELKFGDEKLESYAVIPTFWFAWVAIHPTTALSR
jgi:uncharacterized protein DUF3179